MLKLKLQYFGHLMQRTDSLEKVSNVGKDWGQKEKRASEDDMAGWYYRCNRYEFGQTSGDHEGQGSLACYNPLSGEELNKTWCLNNNKHVCVVNTLLNAKVYDNQNLKMIIMFIFRVIHKHSCLLCINLDLKKLFKNTKKCWFY